MTGRMDTAAFAATVANVRDHFPFSDVARRAGMKLKPAGREWKGCCLFHADKSPSFTVYADDKRGHCFGCGWTGDVIDFVKRAYSVKLREAIGMLDGGVLAELERKAWPTARKADTRAAAGRIVGASHPVEGTPAETYLRSRGITMLLPHTLRFARLAPPRHSGVLAANGAGNLPALVAIVTDRAGDLVGVQRTYLTDDGRKAASADGKVKFSLGEVAGGAIQLGPPAASIVVVEGLEDGLTLAQELARTVWVAAGTSMMPRMMLPDIVESVVIGADNDSAGDKAARLAASAFLGTGRSVRIMRPPQPHKDWNAALMEASA